MFECLAISALEGSFAAHCWVNYESVGSYSIETHMKWEHEEVDK
jgi:hypothetical protein